LLRRKRGWQQRAKLRRRKSLMHFLLRLVVGFVKGVFDLVQDKKQLTLGALLDLEPVLA